MYAAVLPLRGVAYEEEHTVRGYLDVGGLQVAMDDATVVRSFQGSSDLTGCLQGLFDFDTSSPRNTLLKRLSFNKLHGDESLSVEIFEPVDDRYVGVVQGSEELGLALEASQTFGVGGEILGQDLDGDITLELRIARPIHLAHTARTERFEDLVVTECFANHGG